MEDKWITEGHERRGGQEEPPVIVDMVQEQSLRGELLENF